MDYGINSKNVFQNVIHGISRFFFSFSFEGLIKSNCFPVSIFLGCPYLGAMCKVILSTWEWTLVAHGCVCLSNIILDSKMNTYRNNGHITELFFFFRGPLLPINSSVKTPNNLCAMFGNNLFFLRSTAWYFFLHSIADM
jgi:hypothetical protein